MAESRVAHTGMGLHMRRPESDSAEKKAARRVLQAEKCDFGEIQELRMINDGPDLLKSGEAGPEAVAGSDIF